MQCQKPYKTLVLGNQILCHQENAVCLSWGQDVDSLRCHMEKRPTGVRTQCAIPEEALSGRREPSCTGSLEAHFQRHRGGGRGEKAASPRGRGCGAAFHVQVHRIGIPEAFSESVLLPFKSPSGGEREPCLLIPKKNVFPKPVLGFLSIRLTSAHLVLKPSNHALCPRGGHAGDLPPATARCSAWGRQLSWPPSHHGAATRARNMRPF